MDLRTDMSFRPLSWKYSGRKRDETVSRPLLTDPVSIFVCIINCGSGASLIDCLTSWICTFVSPVTEQQHLLNMIVL